MLLLKKRKRNKYVFLIIIITVISIVLSIFFIKFYSDRTVPIIVDYAEDEVKRLVLLVINTSIGESTSEVDTDDLFIVRFNDKGEIVLVDFNSKKSSIVLNGITNLIEYNLKNIEEGNVNKFKKYYSEHNYNLLKKGIVVEIPFGISFNNNFFNNLGPKIPVRISFTRNIETNFRTDVVEYGINNALLKLNIDVKINVRVILPIISDNIDVMFSIPVAMKVIQGQIPSYYMDGFTTNSNIVRGD